jgi:hypothetical protein
MSNYTALLDANVLYPAPLRDLLLQLAVTDIFRARWTEDIHREWIEALLRTRPDLDRARLGADAGSDERENTRLPGGRLSIADPVAHPA